MALVFDGRWQARDASGNAYSGALLYVLDAGGSTPSNIYSDSSLSTPASNPVVADANGIFPMWYAPEGSLYDLNLKTSGGVLIRPYLAIAAVGSQTGSISRDFGTSRFAARGAGGVTYVEAGDATPDNVGGKMTLGGWAGTQADEIDINAALVNVLGRLKENGFRLPGVVRTAAGTFSGATSVVIPLTNDPTGVRAWDIEIIDLLTTGNPESFQLTFSYDGGVSYVTSAVYRSVTLYAYATTSAVTGTGAAGGNAQVGLTLMSPTNVPALLRMRVVTPDTGSLATVGFGQIMGVTANATNAPTIQDFAFTAGTGSGRATHMKITAGSAGNLSGTYRVIPQRGFGET